MSMYVLSAAERSEPFVASLIQSRAEAGGEGLTAADLVGELALPTLVRDPREMATQVIVVAGGAASGKSTLAEALSGTFTEHDVSSAIISSDDFVRGDRGDRRRWEIADKPPEYKYDFRQMRRAIGAVCANQDPGRIIEVSKYDAHTGLAIDGERRRRIPKVDVLIVEGDMLGEKGQSPQVLYPECTYKPLTLYLHVPDEERLGRRVARDMQYRQGHGETPEVIADSFERRQITQHIPYTLTYASGADAILTPAANRTGYDAQTYDMYTMQQR
jgi:uridine kinase